MINLHFFVCKNTVYMVHDDWRLVIGCLKTEERPDSIDGNMNNMTMSFYNLTYLEE